MCFGQGTRRGDKYAETNLDRLKPLLNNGFISQREFDEVEEQAILREKELEEVQAALKLILADDLAEFRKELVVAGKERKEEEGRLRVLLAGSRPEEIEVIAIGDRKKNPTTLPTWTSGMLRPALRRRL